MHALCHPHQAPISRACSCASRGHLTNAGSAQLVDQAGAEDVDELEVDPTKRSAVQVFVHFVQARAPCPTP